MAETTRTVINTGYADQDNDPPGSDAIAFPKSDGYPTIHNGTGGTGTYADPITIAADPRDFPAGTRIYVPSMLFYGMIEDTCAQCIADRTAGRPTKIDFFVGGKNATAAQTAAYENTITTDTATRQIIVDPLPGKNVIIGPLYETNRKTSGNGTGAPDTSNNPPTSAVTLQVPEIFGWRDINGTYSRDDTILSFKDGALRVTGTGYPSAQMGLPATAGQKYVASATLDAITPAGQPIGWFKVTNDPASGTTVVYADFQNVLGPQSVTFTATTPIVRVFVGSTALSTSETVDVRLLKLTPTT